MTEVERVAGVKVNRERVRALTLRDVPALRRLSRALHRRPLPAHELGPVAEAFPGHADAPPPGTPGLRGDVSSRPLSLALRQLGRADLAEAAEVQQDPAGWPDKWLTHETGRVVVAYALDAVPEHALRNGLEQIPAGDTVPAHVRSVAALAERALAVLRAPQLGLRPPAGLDADGRPTIRLLDMEGRRGETDPRWDHVALNRDLTGDDALVTLGHEMFHRVQYAYNPTTDADIGLYSAFREGGARLSEECVLGSDRRYVQDGYLDMPARPLVPSADGAIEPHSYSAGLFWKYLCEQHGRMKAGEGVSAGFDAYVVALETMRGVGGTGAAPYQVAGLRLARSRMEGAGTFDRFPRLYGPGGREVVSTETTWGNFLAANWLHGIASDLSDPRFKYQEETPDPIVWHAVRVAKTMDLSAPGVLPVSLRRGATTPVPAYSSSYYRLDLGDATAPRRLLTVRFEAGGGMTDPLAQLVLVGSDRTLVDLVRLDRASWTRTVNGAGLDHILVIAAARETEGGFLVEIREASGLPLVSATRWNCDAGDSYETDPRLAPWTWTSPDLTAEPDGPRRRIRLRVRNRGDAAAPSVTARLSWQPGGDTPLGAAGWRPIGETQPVPLAVGAETWLPLDWTPPPEAVADFALRAEILAPGDPNEDDKLVLGAFGRVRLPDFPDAVMPAGPP